MRRAWRAQQDIELPDGRLTVSQNALAQALVDGAVMLDRAGGALSVVLERQPTGIPNEMVTTAAIIEWRDRGDAKPQPEVLSPPNPVIQEALEAARNGGRPQLADDVGDGLEVDELAVDERDVPAALRG